RTELRQMPGKNVGKKRAAEHNQRAGEETGRGGNPPLSHPKKHECANGENMERHCAVDRDRCRQKYKEPVRRIEQGSLHPTEIRRSAKDMRVPQRKISLRQFPETEFAPCEVLQQHIAAWVPEHACTTGKQNIAEHR